MANIQIETVVQVVTILSNCWNVPGYWRETPQTAPEKEKEEAN